MNIELLQSALRLSTPLLFAAMGGLLCERAGIATLCLEGVMLAGAWTAAVVTLFTGQPYLGLVAGMAAGAVAMGLHAFLVLKARVEPIISALTVNMVVAGATPLLNKFYFRTPNNTGPIPLDDRLGSTWLIVAALALPLLTHFFLYRTKPGLRLLAAGEGEEALATAGVSPAWVRWWALLGAGPIVALGGVFLSTAHSSQFTRDMTAGRGYIALAAIIFGHWKPIPTLFACLFFGLADATAILWQGNKVFGFDAPIQLIQVSPYVITLLALVLFAGSARPPRSLK